MWSLGHTSAVCYVLVGAASKCSSLEHSIAGCTSTTEHTASALEPKKAKHCESASTVCVQNTVSKQGRYSNHAVLPQRCCNSLMVLHVRCKGIVYFDTAIAWRLCYWIRTQIHQWSHKGQRSTDRSVVMKSKANDEQPPEQIMSSPLSKYLVAAPAACRR